MDTFSTSILFGVLVVLIIFSAFFSCSETAMMALNRYRMRHLARLGDVRAKRTSTLLGRPDRLLGAILIGNTFANIFASSVTTIMAEKHYGEIGIFISTIGLTLVLLVLGEVTPKTLAAQHSERIAFAVSRPLSWILKILYPLVWLVNIVSNGLIRLLHFDSQAKTRADHLSSEELRTVIDEASGRIPPRHKTMLLRILDLKEMTVDDIMVSRQDIEGIDLEEDWALIAEKLNTAVYTRLPLYKGSIDQIVGVLHLRSILPLVVAGTCNKESLEQVALEPYFVPEGTPLTTQLLNFQNNKERVGLVVDEYGDIQGLVTLDDLLEEIVGEVTLEATDAEREIHPQEDGSYLVDGAVNIRELNRALDWKLPVEGPKTLSGIITEYLEMIPPSAICLVIDGYRMEIVQMKSNKVKMVRIKAVEGG